MSDDNKMIWQLVLRNPGKVFGVICGLIIGLIAVFFGVFKAIIFAICIFGGYLIGRIIDNGDVLDALIKRIFTRDRRFR